MPDQTWAAEDDTVTEVLIDSAIPMISGDYNYLVLKVHWETVGLNTVVVTGYLMGIEFFQDTVTAGYNTRVFHHKSPLSKVDINVHLKHGHEVWVDGQVCLWAAWKWICKGFEAFLVRI